MITGGQLLLGFGQIKRRTVNFGAAGNKENHERRELRNHVPHAALGFDDIAQIEAAGQQHDAQQR